MNEMKEGFSRVGYLLDVPHLLASEAIVSLTLVNETIGCMIGCLCVLQANLCSCILLYSAPCTSVHLCLIKLKLTLHFEL